MNKLYVIDGLDGSGKSTQAEIIVDKLNNMGHKAILVSFPDYNEPSSTLVKMYLGGEFGNDANDTTAYAASTFYAVDRYASFKKFWENDYNNGTIIIASRYVSSNILHQMGKLPDDQWESFIDWLDDFEHTKLGLPSPNLIFYLDMPRDVADKLIMSRYNGDSTKKDIHENNMKYLTRCEQAAKFASNRKNWRTIPCSDGEKPYDIEKINANILDVIIDDLG